MARGSAARSCSVRPQVSFSVRQTRENADDEGVSRVQVKIR